MTKAVSPRQQGPGEKQILMEASWLQVLSEETLELLGASLVAVGAVSHVVTRCEDLAACQAVGMKGERQQRYGNRPVTQATGIS